MQEHPFTAHQQRRKGVLLFSQETQTAARMMFDCLHHKAHTDIAVLFFKHAKVVLFDDIAENAAAEQKYEINPAGQRQIGNRGIQCANVTTVRQTSADTHQQTADDVNRNFLSGNLQAFAELRGKLPHRQAGNQRTNDDADVLHVHRVGEKRYNKRICTLLCKFGNAFNGNTEEQQHTAKPIAVRSRGTPAALCDNHQAGKQNCNHNRAHRHRPRLCKQAVHRVFRENRSNRLVLQYLCFRLCLLNFGTDSGISFLFAALILIPFRGARNQQTQNTR